MENLTSKTTYIGNFEIALPAYWTVSLCIHAWVVAYTPYFNQLHVTAIRKKKIFPTAGEKRRWDIRTQDTVCPSFFWTTSDTNIKQNWWIFNVLSDYDN